jgi:membrane protease YdiL (CAAX protease family)
MLVPGDGRAVPVRDILLALAVLGGLVLAALVPVARPLVLVALAVGLLASRRDGASRWAAAAGIPAALILTWGGIAGQQVGSGLADCANPLSPPAVGRVLEAVVVVAIVALLARWLGVGLASLGLRRPTAVEVGVGALAIIVVAAGGLLLGTILAEPFFGTIRLRLSEPAAIVPALALAVANGSMEELAYRGALLSWLGRAAGPSLALVGQAIVFGAAHTGTDYQGEAWPVLLAVATGGLLAGLIVRRTGSLWLPIAVHIGFDVPLYYVAACRLSGVPAT